MAVGSALAAGFSLPAAAETVNEYTLVLPSDLPADATLCQVSLVVPGSAAYVATMLHDDSAPLADGGALAGGSGDVDYRSWVAVRGGARTLVVQTGARNRLNVQAGFCRAPADPDRAAADFFPVDGPLQGGSAAEADLRGYYDGLAEIWVDFCGFDDPFPVVERIQQAFDAAAQHSPDAQVVFDYFDSTDAGAYAHASFTLAGHPGSLRAFADAARAGLAAIGDFDFRFDDRRLFVSACVEPGLWVTVANGSQPVWSARFEGPRLIALRQAADNIFVTYAGGTDSIYLNLAGVNGAGTYPIAMAPYDDDMRAPDRITYGLVHFGGSAGRPHAAGSTAGTVWLTSAPPGTDLSGRFRFSAVDEDGSPRTVTGGFLGLAVQQ